MRKVSLMCRLAGALERRRIGDTPFAIISNNCWGYQLYNDLGRNYNTPFVGLFVMPECYLALLADFQRSISGEIVIGRQSKYRAEPTRYPVGVLPCGAEIHFLHYGPDAEALEKWQRRCARLREAIAADTPLFLKFCDNEGATDEQFARFHAVPFGTKISFSPRALPLPGHVGERSLASRKTGRVGSGTWLYDKRNHWFDISCWIRDGVITKTPLSRLLGLVT